LFGALYPALKRWAIFKEVLHHRGADVLAAFDADDDLADFLLVEVAEKFGVSLG
jgi:hypothetical protein